MPVELYDGLEEIAGFAHGFEGWNVIVGSDVEQAVAAEDNTAAGKIKMVEVAEDVEIAGLEEVMRTDSYQRVVADRESTIGDAQVVQRAISGELLLEIDFVGEDAQVGVKKLVRVWLDYAEANVELVVEADLMAVHETIPHEGRVGPLMAVGSTFVS